MVKVLEYTLLNPWFLEYGYARQFSSSFIKDWNWIAIKKKKWSGALNIRSVAIAYIFENLEGIN